MKFTARHAVQGVIAAVFLVLPAATRAASTAPFAPAKPGWAAVSHASALRNAFSPDGPVVKVWDLSNPAGLSVPRVWRQSDSPAPVEFTPTDSLGKPIWSGSNLGQVFGLAIDDDPKGPFVYAAATAIYGRVVLPLGSTCATPTVCYFGFADLSVPSTPMVAPFNTAPPAAAFAVDGTGAPIYGAVWRLSLNGGLMSGAGSYELIANIPSNGASLGQIAYNPAARRFYVSNFDDGRIYSFVNPAPNSGTVVSTFAAADVYDHGVQGRPLVSGEGGALADDPQFLFTQYGRRVWGLQYNAAENRLYYSVWYLDLRRQVDLAGKHNQIWSVALDSAGRPNPSAVNGVRLEFDIPTYPGGAPAHQANDGARNPFSQPVSDIAFNRTGDVMLLAERGERIGREFFGGYDSSFEGNSTLPHNSRILRYRKSSGGWIRDTAGDLGEYAGDLSSNAAATGVFADHSNSAGGVDFGYDYGKDAAGANLALNPAASDGWIWNSVNSFRTLTVMPNLTYGIQGARRPVQDAGQPTNLPAGQDVLFVDYDDNYDTAPKSMVGDVEVHRTGATGYLQICKKGLAVGEFTFDVPGFGSIEVASGECSQPFEVEAGTLTVTERQGLRTRLIACLGKRGTPVRCDLRAATATVVIKPGGFDAYTTVTFVNRPTGSEPGPYGRPPSHY